MAENVFFVASKLAWLVVAPSNLIALLIAGGVGLGLYAPAKRFAHRAAACGVALFLIVTVLPVGDWLLRPLEQRFPILGACSSEEREPIDGIILLGGSIGSTRVSGSIEENLNEAADRVRYAALLAHRYPQAPILVSGGQVFPRAGARSEAEATAQMLGELGISRDRIRLESASRTTAENARRIAAGNAVAQGRYALVTSASHMPRAIGVFRKQGVNVVAAPTDWRVDEGAPLMEWSVSSRLTNLDLASKEYAGLFAYWVTGRTDELFPALAPEPDCPGDQQNPPRAD